METSILQQLKKKASRLIEPKLLKSGRVLEVRIWEPATVIEVDLYLPFEVMQFNEVPYIKIRVGELTLRDYTPSGWDTDTCTCTIFVDTGHTGPGTSWARNLKRGDTVQYLKIDTTRQAPDATSLIVGLGDESSIGHLLALQQMTLPLTRFAGAVLLREQQHHVLFRTYFRSPIIPLNNQEALLQWVINQGFCTQNTLFYVTGNHELVKKIRAKLNEIGLSNKVKGFWY